MSAEGGRIGLAWRALGALVIALAVLFVFWPSLRGGWVWDDISEVTGNRALRDLPGLGRIWLAPPGPDFFPLKSTVQWLEWHAWGPNPAGYHWVSMACHCLGALLLWRLLAMLGARAAWLGGLLFAVHPLAVESVAWISEQKNVLSLPLLLLAMIAYLGFEKGGARRRTAFGLSLLLFVAAMLCKTSVAMFPAALLLHAWWRRGRISRADLAASAPFFAVSLVLGLVTVWFQWRRAIGAEGLEIGGPLPRLASAGLALAFYARKSLLPVGLMPLYPRWVVDPPAPAQFLPWIVLAGLLAVLWSRRATWGRPVLLGAGFFLINLLPVAGFVPMSFMRLAWVSDHLAYLPLIGPVGLAAAGAGLARERLASRWRPWAGAAAGAVLAALMLAGRGYAGVFGGGVGLWTFAAAGNPASVAAHYNLANALVLAGRVPDSVPEFEAALRLGPDFAEARSNFGDALLRLGRRAEAAAQYEAALRADPALALTRDKLGNLLLERGLTEEAIAQYEKAVGSRPDCAPAQADLAYALARAGRLEEAAGRYGTALRLDPSDAANWDELATVLAVLGRTPEAIRDYERALQLKPDYAEAHNNLGLVLARGGRVSEAVAHFEAALRLKPDFPAARENLERARRGGADSVAP